MNRRTSVALIIGINIFLINLFLVLYTNATYPLVGHDYRLFLSRILDTHLFYKVNGIAIQWYTPSFGSGLPAYPNPLQMQYSLTQLFTWFTNTWNASLLSAVVYASIGFLGAFYFFLKVLEFRPFASILGAAFFIGNGFFIERVVVGHVNFFTFPLIVVPVLAILHQRFPNWLAGALVALTAAIMVYSGGVYIGVINALSFLMILPVIYLIKPSLFSWKKQLLSFLWGGGFTILLCGSKIAATMAFMQNFPRIVHDQYQVNWQTGLGGMIFQLIGVMSTVPILDLVGKNSLTFAAWLGRWTGTPYGFWELDSSLSPALMILLAYGAGTCLVHRPQIDKKNVVKKIIAGILLLISVLLTVEVSIAKGGMYTALSKIFLIKSLHANVRFTSAFILPLVIVGATVFNNWSERIQSIKKISIVFFVLNFISITALWTYLLLPAEIQLRNFDIRTLNDTYKLISAGETFPVSSVVSEMNDYEVFRLRASNVKRHYEPLFRDNNEAFHPLVHDGSVFDIDDGFYNFTNPTGYVFPLENGTMIYERFKSTERIQMIEFLNRRQPDWRLPLYQVVLDRIAGITLLVLSLTFLTITGNVLRNMLIQPGKKM